MLENVTNDNCGSAFKCTTSYSELNVDINCLPTAIKEDIVRFPLMINIIIIIFVGTIGSLLTLTAIPYVWHRYSKCFPHLWGFTTLLLLHLALCDLLYCVIGLPFQFEIFYFKFFPHSEKFCRYSAILRNMIAYADFYTMAGIAVTRCLGICCSPVVSKWILQPRNCFVFCLMCWLMAFILVLPPALEMNFKVNDQQIHIGVFGFDVEHGKCDVIQCVDDGSFMVGGVIYILGVILPFLIILISYVILGIQLRLLNRRSLEVLGDQINVEQRKVDQMLFMLSAAYFMFMVPLFYQEWGMETLEKEQRGKISLGIYSWYWWTYGINFVVYILTVGDLRKVYKLFLSDCVNICTSYEMFPKIRRMVNDKTVIFELNLR